MQVSLSCQGVVKGEFPHSGGRVAVPSLGCLGRDRSRILAPLQSPPLGCAQKQGPLFLVCSLLWLGHGEKGPRGCGGGWWEQPRLLLSEEGRSSVSSLSASKGGWLTEWACCSSLICGGGDRLVSVDLRTESATSSWNPVQTADKNLRGWCSP